MSGYVQSNQPIVLADADITITAQDTGKLILIPHLAANRVITLPAVQAGLHYRFLNSDNNAGAARALSHTATLTPAPAANIVEGTLMVNNGGGPPLVGGVIVKNNAANAVFSATSITGDYMDVYSDGVFWHVSGMSRIADGFA